jgi:hypothetical protein
MPRRVANWFAFCGVSFNVVIILARVTPPLVPAINHPSTYFNGRALADICTAPHEFNEFR